MRVNAAIQEVVLEDLFPLSYQTPVELAASPDRFRLQSTIRLHGRRDRRFRDAAIVACAWRPFDTRWMAVERGAAREYFDLTTRAMEWLAVDGEPFVTTLPVAMGGTPTRLVPMYGPTGAANLARDARQSLIRISAIESDLFYHCVALLTAHRDERVIVPESKERLRQSATLGFRVAQLFSARSSEQEPSSLAVATRVGKEARMLRASALAIDPQWQSRERLEVRPYDSVELDALTTFARAQGVEPAAALEILGAQTCDIYLNEKAFWRNVPVNVWRYAHRGMPILGAWLRDRNQDALGRTLVRDEVTQFSTAVRRIAALMLMGPALAKNAEG